MNNRGTTTSRPVVNSQGSVWRRWDPHLHLPGTLLNDQFDDLSLEDALDKLATAEPTIEAIGVTDYFTTASYRKAATLLEAGVAPSIRFAFPNVELRLDNATSSNRSVNIHLLCRPEEVDRLDQFIGGLEFSWTEKVYRANREGLIQLGRDFGQDAMLNESAALKVGATQFKVNFEELRRHLRTNRWAMENILVAAAGGEGDGTSGLRRSDGAFVARRQSIEALADIVFSSNPKQAQFWLGEGVLSERELERVYRGLKLCLHGSDAHDASRLGVPDQNRFCWLKGDPSFDTLKLGCLSPATRSHIGQESPDTSGAYGRIIGLGVTGSEWFTNEKIDLNPGLVAIIGARGSGKTALADLVAAGAGSTEPFDNDSSFVRRAGRLISDSVAVVDWSHEAVTMCNFAQGNLVEPLVRPVRYLSQQFVERLCASDGVSDRLLSEIERVIFNAWPVGQRQGAVTFRELLEIRLTSATQRQSSELEAVLDLSDRISDMRLRRRALDAQKSQLRDYQKKLAELNKQIASLTKDADKKSAERLGIVSATLRERQDLIERLDRRNTALEGLRSAVNSARSTSFPRHLEQLQANYTEANLTDTEWDAFKIDFRGDVKDILERTSTTVHKEIEALKGPIVDDPESINLDDLSRDDLLEHSLNVLKIDQERLQKRVGLDAARSKRLNNLTKTAGDFDKKIERLKKEIEHTEGENPKELVDRRLGHYRAYFNALLEEESELRGLYAPLADVLQQSGASVAKLHFVVKRIVDVRDWAEQGESLLDLRREGRFRGEGELLRVTQEELVEAWETGDAETAASAIATFVKNYSEDLRKQGLVRGESRDAVGEWERSVSRWLYRTDHIQLRYSLEYDGLSIERLSPGSRGIVLLLLYLAVDQEENDPLIIDQPEENLDPESVYSELVKLFRSASQRRQIIMVTHNANLVVNTDVDQVIVARCGPLAEGRLPELEYVCGGLEDLEIRRLVCEVLEGGAEAFLQRARRLGLDLSVSEPAPGP